MERQEFARDAEAEKFERFLKVEHLDADSLTIGRWGIVSDENLPPTFYKVFRRGDVLYPTRNPHLRRAAVASFDGICGEKTLTLYARESVILADYLPFIFQSESFIDYAIKSRVGSTNPHVRGETSQHTNFASLRRTSSAVSLICYGPQLGWWSTSHS